MASPIVMTEVMNLDVLQSNQINAIKRNTSDAKLQEFAFQSLGIVTEAMIVTIIVMNKSVAPLHARITSSSAKMENAYLKHMFVMEKMIAAITATSHMNTLAFHLLLGAQ
jgi:hypothetical protein